MFKEFRNFIANDSVIKLAVGIIMGTAFTAIVTSLVDDILMPLIVAFSPATEIQDWSYTLLGTNIQFGLFLQAIINFLFITLFLYLILKMLERAQGKKIVSPEPEPEGPSEVELLEAILLELKQDQHPGL